MLPVRKAVIDVGTNSVKLLVADVRSVTVEPVIEKSWQTRLGQGFYATRRLDPKAIEQTALAVAEFTKLARQLEAQSVQVIGTSAAREAENQAELQASIQQACGLPLEVISGDQEAEWVYRGVNTDPLLGGKPLLILDVGGGSSEFILGAGEHLSFSQSFNLGTVRLMELLRPPDPPSLRDLTNCRSWLTDFFNQQLAPTLEGLLREPIHANIRLIGTGGTTTILARMTQQANTFNRQHLEGTRLSKSQVLDHLVMLWSLPLAERKQIVGVPPSRADILPLGVAIYEAVMEHLHFPEIYVSTRGLRFGALLNSPA